MTTQDCKDFLISQYQNKGIATSAKDWKRVSKYKEEGVVMRDFSHPVLGVIVVAETDSGLQIKANAYTTQKDISNKATFIQRDFSFLEKQKAKILVKSMDEIMQESGEWDEIQTHDLWPHYCHAVPSQFFFYFPKDDYHNGGKDITLDSPMIYEGESLNVQFFKKDGEIDEYDNTILRYDLLPSDTDFCDESHLELLGDSKITVREFMASLFERGFYYRSYVGDSSDDDCLFSHQMKNVKIMKQVFASASDIQNDDEKKIKASLIKAIKKDNVQELDKILKAGADINITLPKWDNNLLSLSFGQEAYKCSEYLMDNKIDVWKSHNNSIVCVDVTIRDKIVFKKLLDLMQQQLPNDNLYPAVSRMFGSACYLSQHYKEMLGFIRDNLSLEQVNCLILENAASLSKFDVPTLMKAIKASSDDGIKDAVIKNIHTPFISTWLLGQRKVDISSMSLQPSWETKDKETNVVDYIKNKIEELKEAIKYKQNRGLMLVKVYPDGRQVSELDEVQAQYSSYAKLLEAIDKNKTKMKP